MYIQNKNYQEERSILRGVEMMIKEKESIYQYITRMFEQSPTLPYTFQNVEFDGLIEHQYIGSKKEFPITIKEKMAIQLIKQIEAALHDTNQTHYLQLFLQENPLIIYIQILNKRIKLMISEGLLNKEAIYSLGMQLATESKNTEEVQLGIILMSFYENDVTKKIIKTLGLHSSFTYYAIEAAENFIDYNQFLYELVQHTSGYGKLFALHMFFPFKLEQQQYLFQYGVQNEVAPNLSSIICLEKPEMESFFKKLTISKENFSKLSYMLAYAGEEYDLKQFSVSLSLIEKYISVANEFANSFIDLAAIIMIEKNLIPFKYENDEKINGWTYEKMETTVNICSKIMTEAKRKHILFQQLENPIHQTSLIIKVMKWINVVPNFDDLIPLIAKNVFDMDVMEFLLIDHCEQYIEDVYHLLLKVLPEKIFNEEPQLKEELTPEYKPDVLALFLLKALKKEQLYKEGFILKCVTARFSDLRKEAIKTLRAFKAEWSPNVQLILEDALKKEPDSKIKNRIQRLLNKQHEKEQQYVDISDVDIKPSPWDIPLLKTNIAGTFYRDMVVVEDKIEKGDILYLIRDPDNPYDSKAIFVTTEDGYVLGYVPKVDNEIPASMLDEGEKLYAILESEILPHGKPIIQIMIYNRPKNVGKVISFPIQNVPDQ